VIFALVAGLIVTAVVMKVSDRRAKEQMALDFFAAIQRADAATALSFASDPINDASLLTDAVLKKSAEIAPITNVQVKRSTDDTVTLTMDLLEKRQQIQYDVVKRDGQWKMVQAVKTFQVLESDYQGVAPIINGAKPMNPKALTVFPGVYEMTTGSPYLVWMQPQQYFLLGIPSNDPIFGLQMTDEGKDAARTLLMNKLDACVSSKDLEPSGCPFGTKLNAGYALVAGTVRWSLDEPAEWRAGADGPYLTGYLTLELRLRFDYRHDGKKGTYDKSSTIDLQPKADLRTKDITIAWK